ncbi:GntR family transcriptional regulator [Kordia sp.]|uniref:GntR family transcriptional regulator n=1 Tax=Kordia sp. TaxID=1965332 RepID=UPI003B5C1DEE
MDAVFEKIIELKNESIHSKHEQLVNGIINAINDKTLKKGDRLPSINATVQKLGFARKTIVRAYEDLKSKGIVESKQFKGYYISNINTRTKLKVALLLFAFHSFQEDFYNTFRKELGKKYHIDVFFHHNNLDVFKNILSSIEGKYGMYVIAPIPTLEMPTILKKIPSDKLLIIDRFIHMANEYSYISQEFERSTYQRLEELLPAINKYKKMTLFFRDDADYPIGIKNAFKKFIKTYNIKGTIEKKYNQGSVKPNTLYFFISDTHLWQVLRDCKYANYSIGKEVGILAHNDNDVKEIIFGGITTISADFKKMAQESASYVKHQTPIHRIIPSEIKRRNSL